MLVHCKVTPPPSIKFTGTHLYTWVERGTWLGFKSRLLNLKLSTLTIRPLHLYNDNKENYYMASSVSGQDESNPALWLATRAGKMELSCPLGTTRHDPQEKFPRKPYNKSFIDQACSVKMAGCWSRSFFACFWTSTPSRSVNTQKKNLANIQPSWPHTWSITHTHFNPEST